jgi:hypothetical protein
MPAEDGRQPKADPEREELTVVPSDEAGTAVYPDPGIV